MAEMMRQGDVLLADISLVPRLTTENKEKLKVTGKNEKILAYGEKTGHSHTLRGDTTFYNTGNGMTLCQIGRDGAQLVHQEHDQINIGEGDYIVILQREYDLLEGIRMVSD